MTKIKITVLFDEDRTNHQSTHDEVVDQVANALTENGHKVSLLGIHDNVKELIEKLDALPSEAPRVLLATGKLVGEGFDHPPLDTLVLAMPVSDASARLPENLVP